MISRYVLLLVGLLPWWGGSEGKLYVTKVRPKYFELPEKETVSFRELRRVLHRKALRTDHIPFIHFDQAETPMEVMRLPVKFFDQFFNEQQLIEITLNENLKTLLNGKFRRKLVLQNHQLMKEKLALVRMKLGFLRADNLGDRIDRVIERIPTRLYRFLNPFTALASEKFKATLQGVMRLFYLGEGTVCQFSAEIQTSVTATFHQISSLHNSPHRLFATGQLLISLARRYSSLGDLFRDRIHQFVGELQNMVSSTMAKTVATKARLLHHNTGPQNEQLATKSATSMDTQWKRAVNDVLGSSDSIAQEISALTRTTAAAFQDRLIIIRGLLQLDRRHLKRELGTVLNFVQDVLERIAQWAFSLQTLVSRPNGLLGAKLSLFPCGLVQSLAVILARTEQHVAETLRKISSHVADVLAVLATLSLFRTTTAPRYTFIITVMRTLQTRLPTVFETITQLSENMLQGNAAAARAIGREMRMSASKATVVPPKSRRKDSVEVRFVKWQAPRPGSTINYPSCSDSDADSSSSSDLCSSSTSWTTSSSVPTSESSASSF